MRNLLQWKEKETASAKKEDKHFRQPVKREGLCVRGDLEGEEEAGKEAGTGMA